MPTVTGLTADRMLAIEAASVVDGDVDASGNLILTKHDGSKINAGSVIGPQGPQGPVGSDLAVVTARQLLEVGMANQIRAGRQLGPADFANIGLSAPSALWNLSDLTDASGNGRNLLNKGAVPFATGINGIANTAAQFAGSSSQALYIPDSGAGDPLRIRTGSLGCWYKTSKMSQNQVLISRWGPAGTLSFSLYGTNGTNVPLIYMSSTGNDSLVFTGLSNMADDRWHFLVVTHDGVCVRLYVDCVIEGTMNFGVPWFTSAQSISIGAQGADASTNGTGSMYGRIDEVFITSDVLSDDQIRNLYCAKIGHTLATTPTRVTLNVRRRRRGAALAVSDFPTQPLRLHNFSAGSLGDEGSQGQTLTNVNGALSTSGADGTLGNAFSFLASANQSLQSSDAALPTANQTRSYGCWFKSIAATCVFVTWGSGTGYTSLGIGSATLSNVNSTADTINGPFCGDGLWHHGVIVEDDTLPPGAVAGQWPKRRLYYDGRLVAVSMTVGTIANLGVNGFRVGIYFNNTGPMAGTIDGVFVCNYALTPEQIAALYAKGSQALAPSPKAPGDHIEAMSATDLLATFDTLDTTAQIDLKVAA